MQIVHVPYDESGSPASCNRKKQIIYINDSVWSNLNESLQKIIILHEVGHLKYNTSSELLADEYAYEHFAGSEPKSLKNLINVFDNYLDLMDNNDKVRFFSMATKVLNHDAKVYGNENAKNLLQQFNKLPIMNEVIIKQEIAKFLQSKGIANIDSLNPQQQTNLYVEFMKLPATQALFANMSAKQVPELAHIELLPGEVEHFSLKGAFDKIGSVAKSAVGIASKVTTAVTNVAASVGAPILASFGIPVTSDMIKSVGNLVNPLNIANSILNKSNSDDNPSQDMPVEQDQSVIKTLQEVIAQRTTQPKPADFDEAAYYKLYPDIANYYKNLQGGAWAHYLSYGKAEGRTYTSSNNIANTGKTKDLPSTASQTTETPTTPPKDNKMLYIGLGVGAVVLIIIVILFMKPKKSGV